MEKCAERWEKWMMHALVDNSITLYHDVWEKMIVILHDNLVFFVLVFRFQINQ